LSTSNLLQRHDVHLRPDPARVVVRQFKPATEPRDLNPTDKTRANHIVERVLALDPATTSAQLAEVLENFEGRHHGRDRSRAWTTADRHHGSTNAAITPAAVGRSRAGPRSYSLFAGQVDCELASAPDARACCAEAATQDARRTPNRPQTVAPLARFFCGDGWHLSSAGAAADGVDRIRIVVYLTSDVLPVSCAVEHMIPKGARDAVATRRLAGTMMQRMPALAATQPYIPATPMMNGVMRDGIGYISDQDAERKRARTG
jgi:hypothetical protein